ncbi:MAG TPA: TatD family hydrolase [Thermoleophilia bacterium]|nr:TatD family hydrolase [Thermoleophilia bacterium]
MATAGNGGAADAERAPHARGLIDTHCHLEMLRHTEASLDEAWDAGLEAVLTIGIDRETSRQAVELARRHERVYATVGLHPHDATRLDDELLRELETLAAEPKVVAVGECGLDFYRDLAPRDAQRTAFSAQIELARRAGLPLVVHVREAGDEALDILGREAGDLTVVMHCFSLPDAVELCVQRGYYCSFAGNVTFKSAEALRAAAAVLPDELLLLETDAPYLSPVPFRGKENRPVRVAFAAAAVAAARGWSTAHAAAVTTANARRAFGLPG